jgi:phosphopantetheinyl transferase
MIVLPLPHAWKPYALVVEHREDDLLDQTMFRPAELSMREAMTLPKRRREWTASRQALKMLANERGMIADGRDAIIESDRESRPHLREVGSGRSWCASLSHSRGLAAAAIDLRPIGIDVERVRPLSSSAAHLFLTEEEAEACARTPIENALLHAWCAKEAAWKAVSSEHDTLKSVPLRLVAAGEQGLTWEGPALTIETRRLRPEIVAALARTV